MTIPNPPTAPNPSDPATFDPRAVAWVAWWMAAIPEINALSGMTNSGQFLDGLQTAPGITFVNDPDTGIYRATSNQIAVATGGVKRFLISTVACVVDVPISGTAVMSNETDSTSGKLMPVGAFGLGKSAAGTAITAIDATNIPSGFYAFTTGATGTLPAGITAAGGGSISMFRESATKGYMLLQASGTNRIFVRNLNTTWGAWQELQTTVPTSLATQGTANGGFAGGLVLRNNGTGANTGCAFDASVRGILVGGLQVAESTAFGAYTRLLANTDGGALGDRRFIGIQINPDGSHLTPLVGNPSVSLFSYHCRAWASFDGFGPNIRGAGNVGSIGRPATGVYDINFNNAMPDTNYAITLAYSNELNGQHAVGFITAKYTSGFQVAFYAANNSTQTVNKTYVDIAVFR